MAGSRRNFIKFGALAALFAAMPLKSVFGQGWKDRDGNPNPSSTQTDPLSNYTEATFRSYLNSIFQLHTVGGIVEVTLVQVDSMPAPRNGECFTLLFRGGARVYRQDTYTLVHPSLGTFQLLLVPAGTDKNGAQGYVATINRLSLADAANMAAPIKGKQASQPPTTPPASAAPATTPRTQPSRPDTQTPNKTEIPKKRKPSRKSINKNPFLDDDWLN